MNRKDLLKEMEVSVGAQAPVIYFEKMTTLLGMLFDHIEKLEVDVAQMKARVPLAIQWEPRVASDMISKEIVNLKRIDRATYAAEISALQRAYAEDVITQEYADFCNFWQDTLGYHPFLDYDK